MKRKPRRSGVTEPSKVIDLMEALKKSLAQPEPSRLRKAAQRCYDWNRLSVSVYEEKYNVHLETSLQFDTEGRWVWKELEFALAGPEA